ncbi:hypothetical protein PINS_up012704 [Pythium insidiosum]|nr:hypothetical protein PINS_up012704 [Pythium insidiosum]
MHLAEAFQACTKDGCDVFDGLGRDERRQSRRLIIAMVLATDLSGHLKHVNKLKSKRLTMQSTRSALVLSSAAASTSTSSPQEPTHAFVPDELLLRTALMMADIGHATKPFAQHLAWSRLVTEEFFRQGDTERQYGLPVSPLCDREHCQFEKSQIGFLEFVVLPLYSAAESVLPLRLDDVLERVQGNLATWRCRAERVANGLAPEGDTELLASGSEIEAEAQRGVERRTSAKPEEEDGVVVLDEAELQQLLRLSPSSDDAKSARA